MAVIGAGLLLATQRPPPLRLIIMAGLAGAGVTLISGLLRLDAAQLAQPPRLIQGVTYALYAAILAGADLALIAGGAAMLWSRAFPALPAIEAQFGIFLIRRPAPEGVGYGYEGHLRGLAEPAQAGFVNVAESFSSTESARYKLLWSDGCRLGLMLLPALLAFGALRAGLSATPGAVRSPGAISSFAPAAIVLLEGGLSALRATLLLAGSAALLSIWRPLRSAALPLVALGALLVAAQPDRLALLLLALLAWSVAVVLAQRLRGNLVALLLALWMAACLPDALALLALDQWWYAANGALALMLLIAPVLLLRERNIEPAAGQF